MLSVPFRCPRAISGADDQRLRVGCRVRDEAHPRVELGAVREHGLAVLAAQPVIPTPYGNGASSSTFAASVPLA